MTMRGWLICFIFLFALIGCNTNKSCQKDYWNDSDYEIFGRKNCIGRTGAWVDENNGRSGYYCTSPQCTTAVPVTCEATCKPY